MSIRSFFATIFSRKATTTTLPTPSVQENRKPTRVSAEEIPRTFYKENYVANLVEGPSLYRAVMEDFEWRAGVTYIQDKRLTVVAKQDDLQFILLRIPSGATNIGYLGRTRGCIPGFRFEKKEDGIHFLLVAEYWDDGVMSWAAKVQDWLLPELEVKYPLGKQLRFSSVHGESTRTGQVGKVSFYGTLDDGSGIAHLIEFQDGVSLWAYPQELTIA